MDATTSIMWISVGPCAVKKFRYMQAKCKVEAACASLFSCAEKLIRACANHGVRLN